MNPTKQRLCSRYRKALKKNMTPAERKMQELLKDHNIHAVAQKAWLKNGFFISDFYIPKRKLVIEIDGPYHSTAEQKAIDRKKDAYYLARGFGVVRFTNHEVMTRAHDCIGIIQGMTEAIMPLAQKSGK